MANAYDTIALTEKEKIILMRYLKRLAQIFDEACDPEENDSESYRNEGPNPFRGHTQTGIYLEFFYGSPSAVWTPWGYWRFAMSLDSETAIKQFMNHLTVRIHIPERQARDDRHDPIYAILAIDGDETPEPALPATVPTLDFQNVMTEWHQLYASC